MSDVFKAIQDNTRREILILLSKRDYSAGEIAEHFDISKPAITKHLDVLKKADLVTSKKEGTFVIYSLNATVLQETLVLFLSFFDKKE